MFDKRNCEATKRPILYMEDGSEVELPMKWEVCHVCEGEGKHVNPSIDSNGISMQDFHEDPDFAEDYFGGVYDQQCNACRGRSTVPVVDWDALTAEQSELYRLQLKDDADWEAERQAEMMMGC